MSDSIEAVKGLVQINHELEEENARLKEEVARLQKLVEHYRITQGVDFI